MMYRRTLLLLLLLTGTVTCFASYIIKGNLGKIGNGYYPKVYLSYIRSVNGLYETSSRNVINSAPVAADGSFVLTGNEIPVSTAFYCVYLTPDESTNAYLQVSDMPNFIIMALNSSSQVELKANAFRSFNDVTVVADGPNIQIRRFFKFATDLRSKSILKPYMPEVASAASIQHFQDGLLKYADTSKNALVSLLALIHIGNWQRVCTTNRSVMELVIRKLGDQDPDSPYLPEIHNILAVAKMRNNEFVMNNKTLQLSGVALLLTIFVLFLLLFLVKRNKRSIPNNSVEIERLQPRFRSLTSKEMEVAQLLTEKLSNKEISIRLDIGASTVKTHISNIYNKLGVGNRTELLNILLLLKNTG